MTRVAILFPVLLLLCSCAGHESVPAAGQGNVVFVDAAGNRMTVDVGATAPAAKPSPDSGRVGTMPAGSSPSDSPGHANAESTAARPVNVDDAAPVGIEYNGTVYQDVDQLPPELRKREGERFYQVPDGQGRMQTLDAATLGVGSPSPLPPVEHSTPFADQTLPCPAGEPVLEHLLDIVAPRIEDTLRFPVYDPSLRTSTRYAGYRMKIPSGMRAAGLRFVADPKKGAPDLVLVLADADMRPWMVVNNKVTETIPETPFRYAMVAMNLPLGANVPPGSWLVVIEGVWARRILAEECRPQLRTGPAVAGQLVLRFLPGLDNSP